MYLGAGGSYVGERVGSACDASNDRDDWGTDCPIHWRHGLCCSAVSPSWSGAYQRMTREEGPGAPRLEPVEEATLWRLALEGLQVARLACGVSLQLELSENQPGSRTWVKVEIHGPLVCGPELAPSAMDPGAADRAPLGRALNLFLSTVSEALAYKNGRLEMRFVGGRERFPVDGWVLRADPDSKYESWEVRGPGGRLIVCSPGGELFIWGSEPLGTVGELTRKGFFDSAPFKRDR
jgi:hypothetical protein